MIYRTFLRPVLFQLDPEVAHDAAIRWGERCQQLPGLISLSNRLHRITDDRLTTTVAGIRFSNPIGLAAGFDKSGRIVDLLASLGFGHVEIGSISRDASAGNARPRLWRLSQDEATLVHYGLPNDGATSVADRLSHMRLTTPLGINLVNTHRPTDTTVSAACLADAILDDYVAAASRLQVFADYLMLNLSCPNTVDGRGFFEHESHLSELLQRLNAHDVAPPIFLKLSPELDDRGLDQLLNAVNPHRNVRGLMFNLSPRFREGLKTPRRVWENHPGAISGRPIREWMDDRVAWLYGRIDPARYQIIAAGGITTGEDAYRRIRCGASLVQLYTALIYRGPGLPRRLNRELSRCLERDGFDNISEAVGVNLA